jgi:hypothetical protein
MDEFFPKNTCILHRCFGGDLDPSLFLAIPLLDDESLPTSAFIPSDTFHRGQMVAFLAWTTLCTGLGLGWFIQGCIIVSYAPAANS